MARRPIHDDDDEFDDFGDDLDQEDELAREGYFVENEDGMEESKKSLEIEDEEAYFLDPSGQGVTGPAGLLDEYQDHLEDDEHEEDGDHAEENS